jgi:hypothetical protein
MIGRWGEFKPSIAPKLAAASIALEQPINWTGCEN